MNNKTLTGLITAAALTGTFSAMTPANAANPFVVTAEASGVEQSQLYTNSTAYGATGVYQDTFDTNTPGPSSSLAFGNVGTFTNAYINSADQYGGAGGNTNYFDVNSNLPGGYTSSTLKLTTPESYFGLWWSAGDANNVMSFYSGDKLIQTFTTADVNNFISQQTATVQAGYKGNPNTAFSKQNSGENYAYLNFFAGTGVTFDKIVFSNIGGSGFESDNFTVASSYTKISGSVISTQQIPESSSFLGIIVTGFVGISSIITRRKNRNSEEVVG